MSQNAHVFIYYSNSETDKDNAYERAARWAHNQVESVADTITTLIPVTKKQEFIDTWNALAMNYRQNDISVLSVTVFFPTSENKHDDTKNGLQFSDDILNRHNIAELSQLPWIKRGTLNIKACNSGLMNAKHCCIAQVFSASQKVLTNGESGFVYFSNDAQTHQESKPQDKEIHLRAYLRRRNDWFGDGSHMPSTEFYHGRNMKSVCSVGLTLEYISPDELIPSTSSVSSSQFNQGFTFVSDTTQNTIKRLFARGDQYMQDGNMQQALNEYTLARDILSECRFKSRLISQLIKDVAEEIENIKSLLSLNTHCLTLRARL